MVKTVDELREQVCEDTMKKLLCRAARMLVMSLPLILSNACKRDECPERLQLDQLLGGGVPVCLGGSFDQLEAYRDRAEPDTISSLAGFGVREGGALYGYDPGGGLDLIILRPLATSKERACPLSLRILNGWPQ